MPFILLTFITLHPVRSAFIRDAPQNMLSIVVTSPVCHPAPEPILVPTNEDILAKLPSITGATLVSSRCERGE